MTTTGRRLACLSTLKKLGLRAIRHYWRSIGCATGFALAGQDLTPR